MVKQEKAKRKTPKPRVVRELYMLSGNVCAYPGCKHRIIDDDGTYIADLCHIEAAEEGGERFNPNMSNEERRSFANLMLMCTRHHRRTDNLTKYPVAKLQQLKAEHEAKFRGAVEKIAAGLTDKTNTIPASEAHTLSKAKRVLKWRTTEAELIEAAVELESFVKRLQKVPIPTRLP